MFEIELVGGPANGQKITIDYQRYRYGTIEVSTPPKRRIAVHATEPVTPLGDMRFNRHTYRLVNWGSRFFMSEEVYNDLRKGEHHYEVRLNDLRR